MTMRTQPERAGRCGVLAFALLGVVAVTAAARAEAQAAGSFGELQRILNQGDRVTVTDRTGRDLTGRLIDLSPAALALEVEGVRLDLRDADVALVRQWRRDALRNGALIGLAAGAVPASLFAVYAYSYAKNEGRPPPFALVAAAASLGAGVAIGMEVDRQVDSQYVIYGQTRRSGRRVTVSPLLSRDSRGVALSLGF